MKNEKLRQNIFSKRIFTKGCISHWPMFGVCCLLVLPVLFIACEYNNKPAMIYDPTVANDTTGRPTITGILPAAQAAAGAREITIIGTNLGIKNGTDTNWVFIGGVRPKIKDIQNSSITIYRPQLSTDKYDKSILVSVTDPKMLTESSNKAYVVESPGAIAGDYTSLSTILAADCDNQVQENLYTTAGKNLYKTDFAGVTQSIVLNPVNLLSGDYNAATAISFGPGTHGRNIFIAVGKNYIARLYVADTLARTNLPIKLTVPAAVSQLDFDENGYMYTGGDGILYVADTSVASGTAPTFTQLTGYAGGMTKKIRVVKESGSQYLYVADSLRVWKSPVSGTSSTFNPTLLVDLITHPELSGCTISSFELDENGSVFLCLKHHPIYSLFIREYDGSITPFYGDPNILPNTVDKLMWGNSKYLYLISSSLQSSPGTFASGRIYRLILDRNGAPYQGRKFIK
jgi:hypothetical protein